MIMYLNNHLFSKNYGMAGAVSVVLFLVCAVLCVVVYFSLTKADDGLTRAPVSYTHLASGSRLPARGLPSTATLFTPYWTAAVLSTAM